MPRFPTDPQLTTLVYLALNENGYSSTELVELLENPKMDKPRFSRDVLKPLREKNWITIEKSSGNCRPGRPREILKIKRDISIMAELFQLATMKEKESEIENVRIHKEALEHMADIDFDPERWDLKIKEIETSLEFYAYLSSTFYELMQVLSRSRVRVISPTAECTPDKPLSTP